MALIRRLRYFSINSNTRNYIRNIKLPFINMMSSAEEENHMISRLKRTSLSESNCLLRRFLSDCYNCTQNSYFSSLDRYTTTTNTNNKSYQQQLVNNFNNSSSSSSSSQFCSMSSSSKSDDNLMDDGHEINTKVVPFLIGVAGGTASGKSSVCQNIMDELGQSIELDTQQKVVLISQDSFYKQLDEGEKIKAIKGLYNFDHPNALDIELMMKTLLDVLNGRKTEVPVYDYVTNSRIEGKYTTIYPADVVLFEGILAFYFPQFRDLFHMKLFVDQDPDTRLARRVVRDVQERGRDLDTVLTQYMTFVKQAFEEFCLPTKKFADVIIPRGADNKVENIRELLRIQENNSYTFSNASRASSESSVSR